MSKPQPVADFRPQVMLRLLAVLAVIIVPLAWQIQPWLLAVATALGLWCYLITRGRLKLPGLALRMLIASLLLLAVHSHYGTLVGRDAGAALLVAMLTLKLVETKGARDIYIVVFLGYFLIIIAFLFTQSLWMAAYLLVAVILLTSVLIDLNRAHDTAPADNLRLATGMLLRALPMALLLFVLFPRIAGPLWGLPKDAYSGMSGLNDEMSPGEISELSLSDAVAFRATFDGPVPPPQQRYWRGPVLWDTDGNRWQANRLRENAVDSQPPPFTRQGGELVYTVTLEPHNRRWLYGLDLVAAVPATARITPDFTLVSASPVRERQRYMLHSYPDGTPSRLNAPERLRALLLPAEGNRRARELARRWRERYHGDSAIVEQALQYFHHEPFVYTLKPPLADDDFVDTFLFATRKGFCEHYAASFTFLMRAAGIPARVVTGYQGGELNTIGNYLIVRQLDAHAWSEVWLEGRGWTRVDPTAAVAPERIEHSIDNNPQQVGAAVRFDMGQTAWLRNLWRETRFALDAVNNKWNQWILSYGPDRQAELLGWLSLAGISWQSMAVGLLGILMAILVGVLIYLHHWQQRPRDLAVVAYENLCRKLARRGLARLAHEGPSAYATRIAAQRPDLASQAQNIIRLYIAMRYASHHSVSMLKQLRRAVGQFKP